MRSICLGGAGRCAASRCIAIDLGNAALEGPDAEDQESKGQYTQTELGADSITIFDTDGLTDPAAEEGTQGHGTETEHVADGEDAAAHAVFDEQLQARETGVEAPGPEDAQSEHGWGAEIHVGRGGNCAQGDGPPHYRDGDEPLARDSLHDAAHGEPGDDGASTEHAEQDAEAGFFFVIDLADDDGEHGKDRSGEHAEDDDVDDAGARALGVEEEAAGLHELIPGVGINLFGSGGWGCGGDGGEDTEETGGVDEEEDGGSPQAHHEARDGRADDAGEVELNAVEGDGFGEVFAGNQAGDEDLPGGDVKDVDDAIEEREGEEEPGAERLQVTEDGQEGSDDHEHALGDHEHALAIGTVGDDAADGTEDDHGGHGSDSEVPHHDGCAGLAGAGPGGGECGLRHDPADTDVFHPGADVGTETGDEDVAEVVVLQGTALPPGKFKHVTIGGTDDDLGRLLTVGIASGEFSIWLSVYFLCLSGHRHRLRSVVPLRHFRRGFH